MRLQIQILLCFVSVVFLVLLAGCGNGMVPLKGKVTFSDNDEPLTIGTVCYGRAGYMARGALSSNGHYVMGSLSQKDGLKPGTYQVFIIAAEEDLGDMKLYSPIDPKYSSGDTSGITVEVDGKTRSYDFKVDRNPKPRPKVK